MIYNYLKKITVIVTILLTLSLLAGCSGAKTTGEVTISESTIGETITISEKDYEIDGRFCVFLKADIIHPKFTKNQKILKDASTNLALAIKLAQPTIHIVIRRNNEIVFVAGDSINAENCFFADYTDTKYDNKLRKLTGAGFIFFIPDEYRDDDIRFIATDVNNFGYSRNKVDGVTTVKYTQPDDVWFEYTVK